jgi:hypothetical protein
MISFRRISRRTAASRLRIYQNSIFSRRDAVDATAPRAWDGNLLFRFL